MIKFKAKSKDGNTLVGLGLSEGNIKRLKAKQPILIRGTELNIDHDISIMYGETEESLKEELKEYFTYDCKIEDHR